MPVRTTSLPKKSRPRLPGYRPTAAHRCAAVVPSALIAAISLGFILACPRQLPQATQGTVVPPEGEWRGTSALRGWFVVRDAVSAPAGFPTGETDFTRHTLLGAFLGAYTAGPSMTHSIAIVRVTDAEVVTVDVERRYSKTWHKVEINPPRADAFHLVAIPATRKAVLFRVRSQNEAHEIETSEISVPAALPSPPTVAPSTRSSVAPEEACKVVADCTLSSGCRWCNRCMNEDYLRVALKKEGDCEAECERRAVACDCVAGRCVARPVEDETACATDDDCVRVEADCCGCTSGGDDSRTVINRRHLVAWNERFRARCKGTPCLAVMGECISGTPRCRNQRCAFESSGAFGMPQVDAGKVHEPP